MKSFEPPSTTITLKFTDPEWEDAEIVCEGDVPLETLLTYAEFDGLGEASSVEQLRSFASAMRKWGDEILLSWNLTHKGEPRPADGDGFASLGVVKQMTIFGHWFQGITAAPLVPAGSPLSTPSVNGGASRPRPSSRKAAA